MSKLLANRVNKPGSSLSGPGLKTLDESEEVDLVEEETLLTEITPNKVFSAESPTKTTLSPTSSAIMAQKLKQKRATSMIPNSKLALKKQLNTSAANFLPELELPGSARSGENKSSLLSGRKNEIVYEDTNKHADLTTINFSNELEKNLITRIFSNVNKLSSILNDIGSNNGARLRAYLTTPDPNDCLPLYYAIKCDCLNAVRILIAAGSPIDRTTSSGDPAPHLACLLGVSIELIDYLLSIESGDPRSIYKIDQEGWTVLHCASNQGHLEVVKYLIEKKFMNPNVRDAKFRFTGLQLATLNNRIDVINYYLSFLPESSLKRPEITRRPLKPIANILPVSSGCQAAKKSRSSFSPLPSQLSYYRDETLMTSHPANVYKNFTIDLNSQNSDGQTVMHLACAFGRYEVVETLLKKYGSHLMDVNWLDFRGRTCLDLAYFWLSGQNPWEETAGKPSIMGAGESSSICDHNDRIEAQIKLINLLMKYGAKFSSISPLVYDLGRLIESELDADSKLQLVSSIRTHLRLIEFVLELNLPTMILNLNQGSAYNDINLLARAMSSSRSERSSEANQTSTSQFSEMDLNITVSNMKIQLASNLNSLAEFVQRVDMDSFEKQMCVGKIHSLTDSLARF